MIMIKEVGIRRCYMFKNLDFSPGIVVYDDFNIDKNIPLKEQFFSLKEDLFQVSYKNDMYLIDIGWYSDLNLSEKFRVVIIKNYDWDAPIYSKKTKDLKQLDKIVKECAEIVRKILEEK